jgi:hypothetical protein
MRSDGGGDNLILSFSMASKGGGSTAISVHVGENDFEAIINEILEAKRKRGTAERSI